MDEALADFRATPTVEKRDLIIHGHIRMTMNLAIKFSRMYPYIGDEFLSVASLALVQIVEQCGKTGHNVNPTGYIYAALRNTLAKFVACYNIVTAPKTNIVNPRPDQRLVFTDIHAELTEGRDDWRFTKTEMRELCAMSTKSDTDRQILEGIRHGRSDQEVRELTGLSLRQFTKARERIFNHFIYLWGLNQ